MSKKAQECPECGCQFEYFGKERLCPWCNEDRMEYLATEALRKNRIYLDTKYKNSGRDKLPKKRKLLTKGKNKNVDE